VLPSGKSVTASPGEYVRVLLEHLAVAESDDDIACLAATLIAFSVEEDLPLPSVDELDPGLSRMSDAGKQAHVWGVLGSRCEGRDDYAAAVKAYARGILLEPDDRDSWYFLNNNIGFSWNQLHEYDRGERHCRIALRCDPRRPNAYKNLALALQGQGRLTEAARLFIAGTEAYPRDPRSLAHLEELVAEHPEIRNDISDIEEMIEACAKAVDAALEDARGEE